MVPASAVMSPQRRAMIDMLRKRYGVTIGEPQIDPRYSVEVGDPRIAGQYDVTAGRPAMPGVLADILGGK